MKQKPRSRVNREWAKTVLRRAEDGRQKLGRFKVQVQQRQLEQDHLMCPKGLSRGHRDLLLPTAGRS
jgi:hypothetical protein